MDSPEDRTASLMTPAKLAQAGAARATPVSPAAWLDKMATDAGHMHITRLAELRSELESQARARIDAPVGAALDRLAQALQQMDFALLQPQGWWARTTGKSRSAGAQFAQQLQQAEAAGAALATDVQALQQRQPGQAGGTDRTLLELDVEVRAIDKIIDQGARWLQDMRNQIKARQAQATDDAGRRQLEDDTARCELLVARLKALRACATAAQAVHQQGQATVARRSALPQRLHKLMATELKSWRSRMTALATALEEGKTFNLEAPTDSQAELQRGVQEAQADAAQLLSNEQTLAQALVALGDQLAATR